MKFLFPSRARLKTSPTTAKLTASLLSRTSSTLPDILWTSVVALKESADAFPPLKSVVGGVIALCDIAERAKHSRAGARAIAYRTKEILDIIADAVPDASEISPSMLLSIERFALLLEEIKGSMEVIVFASGVSRVFHLNRDERVVQDIKTRLDEAYRDFLVSSTLRQEVQQTALAVQQKEMHLKLKMVSATTSNLALDFQRLLLYARHTVLFGRPLLLPYKLQ
ncbi:hypothetical protein K438DRAFT_1798096 [Mycena galopus ATCC 62051]|nr:hypothetical protein K438DRAFT_1798096 [Mycena galopus ATCC 62051]